jgi:ketosteroid isomerase-like protein
VTSNADIVRTVTAALDRGDALAVMAHLSRDVVWTIHAEDVEAAPWFGQYRGKRAVAELLEVLATIGFTETPQTGFVADGDTVVTLAHLVFDGPNGRHVETDEAQIWHLVDGRIVTVDVLLDTAAVAAGFR